MMGSWLVCLVWGCACCIVEFGHKDVSIHTAKLWPSDELLGDVVLLRTSGTCPVGCWAAPQLTLMAKISVCLDAQYKLREGNEDLLIFKWFQPPSSLQNVWKPLLPAQISQKDQLFPRWGSSLRWLNGWRKEAQFTLSAISAELVCLTCWGNFSLSLIHFGSSSPALSCSCAAGGVTPARGSRKATLSPPWTLIVRAPAAGSGMPEAIEAEESFVREWAITGLIKGCRRVPGRG